MPGSSFVLKLNRNTADMVALREFHCVQWDGNLICLDQQPARWHVLRYCIDVLFICGDD